MLIKLASTFWAIPALRIFVKKVAPFEARVLFIGPSPHVIGGTAAMLNRLIPALEKTGVPCRIFNTKVGNPRGNLRERIGRLGLFLGLSLRVAWAPEKVVHCHAVNFTNLMGHGFVLLACRLAHKRSVITLHAGDLQAKFTSGRSRAIGRAVLGLANVVTSVTPQLSRTVTDMGVSNSCFIANGFQYFPQGTDDTSGEFPPEISRFIETHSPVIILVGAMDRIYGVDILVRATIQLRRSFSRVGALVIAFKSDSSTYKVEIADLIDSNRIQDAVLIPAPFVQIAEAMRQSDVLVRPTLSDGDSIVIREALTLGLPTIASDVGYRPEGVRLFRSEDHEDLARVIEDTINNPTRNTINTAETETETLAKYLDAYRQALT